MDDNWNIDGDRNLSEPWTSFTQFTILNEKPLDGFLWARRRLTKIQATTKPGHLWPEILSGMSTKAAVGHGDTEARPCATVERHLFH